MAVTDHVPTDHVLTDHDVRLIAEGRHRRLWEVLGARVEPGGGVSFAVLAPAAREVRVRGDFNGWDGAAHVMRRRDGGVWELFVPEARTGHRYRYAVLGADGRWREKADPVAGATQCPPENASVVFRSEYRWGDGDFRARRDWAKEPMSVYEVHLGSWMPGKDGRRATYRELAHELGDHVVDLGFTHVQLMPVTEHPFGGSWGYQVTSYFAPTARFGTPDDFRYLVDHLHRRGIGVLLDFVPAHFPRDDWALARFDGTPLYEHPDPRRGEHPDWGTLVFDFGRPAVRDFLISSALYWLTEFHLDGLRVDAVSSMLYLDYSRGPGQWEPNAHGGNENLEAVALLRELTDTVHREVPGAVVVAEESTAWPGVTAPDGLGFDLKWNLGWMHDVLGYLGHDPLHRAAHHGELEFPLDYAWNERYVLPLSHDEVVHGKGSLWQRMPGDDKQRAAGLRALLAYTWAHPGKQLLFMGGEFGQPPEWDSDGSLSWELADSPPHQGIRDLVRRLNHVYRRTPALHATDDDRAAFAWHASDPARNVVAFRRTGPDGTLLCAANFSGVPQRLDVGGPWTTLLDSERPHLAGEHVTGVLDLPASTVTWLFSAEYTENSATR
ncbi:1,4-alpha-glucan branching protein GlgB [Saccharothrix syringae]|uniref:1,4-alpha-glucan branching enzyme GlgB n=1 Tax=Saccharothrix syringae TaxID=103733 RepID=A0A5Q0HEI8_SACSY|nr:1,4-alpha-glucan branching protein GlgB [Saccharothrix syringae]QFZ24581.1 1,4-alpha-glucan branching protein GlgB [Saccharothrix syringae]